MNKPSTYELFQECVLPKDCQAHFFTKEAGKKAGKKNIILDCGLLGTTWKAVNKKIAKISTTYYWRPELIYKPDLDYNE
jgi:hypothetical protein